jgi:PAS domain S-box-containing protein
METARAMIADPGGAPPPLPSRVRAPAALSEADVVWSLLNRGSDAVLLADRDGEVLLANDSAVELLGRADEDLVGRDLDDLIPGLEAAATDMTGHPSEPPLLTEARAADGPLPVEVRVGWISTDEERILAVFLRSD